MKIEINRAYFVPTQELEEDFLKQAGEQGFLFRSGNRVDEHSGHLTKQEELCICVDERGRLVFSSVDIELDENGPESIIKWKIENPEPKNKFSVGDSAVIVANTNNHGFPIGETVKIIPSMVHIPINRHFAESLKSGIQWYVADTDIAPIDNSTRQDKPTIIRLGNLKIVFNGDYTIVTDGRFTGKAKRNHADEYDAVVGLKLAVERYEKSKKDYFKSLTAEEIIKAISGGKTWIK